MREIKSGYVKKEKLGMQHVVQQAVYVVNLLLWFRFSVAQLCNLLGICCRLSICSKPVVQFVGLLHAVQQIGSKSKKMEFRLHNVLAPLNLFYASAHHRWFFPLSLHACITESLLPRYLVTQCVILPNLVVVYNS